MAERRAPYFLALGIIIMAVAFTSCQIEDKLKSLKSKNLSELQAILSKVLDSVNETEEVTTRDPRLTGDPRKDYIYDPNLPRELGDHNLSTYPFYNEIPKDITFKCDGKLDGYYASVPHHCQLFHLCVFGHRHDFLCANYTVFDQSQFICHFVNSVNCSNSVQHYVRNSELYVTTTPEPPEDDYTDYEETEEVPRRRRPKRRRKQNNRRRQGKRRRTTTTAAPDEYYYDYEDGGTTAANEEAADAPPEQEVTTTTEKVRRPVIRPPRPKLRTPAPVESLPKQQSRPEETPAHPPEEAPAHPPDIPDPQEPSTESAISSRSPSISRFSQSRNRSPHNPISDTVEAPSTIKSRRRRPDSPMTTTTEEVKHDPMAVVDPASIVGGILSGAGASPPATTARSQLRRAQKHVKTDPPPSESINPDPVAIVDSASVVGGILSGAGASPPVTKARPQLRRAQKHVKTDSPPFESINPDPAAVEDPASADGEISSGADASPPVTTSRSQRRRAQQQPTTAPILAASIHPNPSAIIGQILSGAGVAPIAPPAPRPSSIRGRRPSNAASREAVPSNGSDRQEAVRRPSGSEVPAGSAPPAPTGGAGRIRVVQRVRKPVATTTTTTASPSHADYEYAE